ncbi:sensor domain-containing diguanylate cyclase [Macromonas nakdongensis]|uniref:sensor domain-containing diguanylate cyclase n=1 Tax=Macromonas nakdongensis TaxID=1843082 RepID=UPI000C31BCBA|nr:GGDEF domain-containing protein [Macromonas nakdongensis]
MKMNKQALGIRLRLWLAAALPAVIVVLMLLFGFLERHGRELTTALSDRAQASSKQLGGAAEFPLFAGDGESLQRLVDAALAGDPHMRGVAIYPNDPDHKRMAGKLSYPLPDFGPDNLLRITPQNLLVIHPVYLTLVPSDDPYQAQVPRTASGDKGRLMGHVVMEFTLESLLRQKQDVLLWSVAVTVLALLLAAVVATFIASSVTGPLQHISAVVGRIAQGDLSARADVEQVGVMEPLAVGVNAMAERVALNQGELQAQVHEATQELRRQKEAAEMAARIDPLTGVFSRRAFTEAAETEMQRALRYGLPLSLIMIDLDHFKAVNDTYGHAMGDAVLASFARTIAQEVREVDVIGRMGGEEFVVLLPSTEVTEAVRVAERMRLAVASGELQAYGDSLRYTASFGVAAFDPRELSLNRFMDRADAALYEAKRAGRNRVELAPALPV